ncbi:MAG: lycopene cyclase domain-containing protein [Acidimicrobiales bacterium]
MPEYTIASIAGVVAVVVVELLWLRTGIFTTARFWIAYAIVIFFQVLVDGWLTKLSAPIVLYAPEEFSGWRVPFDVPVEDYLFGFALIALTIMLWERAARQREAGRSRGGRDGGSTTQTGTAPTLPR